MNGSAGGGEEFPLAPMGVLAPGSAHTRPSARPPIDTSGNFPAHVSAELCMHIAYRGIKRKRENKKEEERGREMKREEVERKGEA